MKKLFLALTLAMFSFTLTACGLEEDANKEISKQIRSFDASNVRSEMKGRASNIFSSYDKITKSWYNINWDDYDGYDIDNEIYMNKINEVYSDVENIRYEYNVITTLEDLNEDEKILKYYVELLHDNLNSAYDDFNDLEESGSEGETIDDGYDTLESLDAKILPFENQYISTYK